jgi:hypothetical protein
VRRRVGETLRPLHGSGDVGRDPFGVERALMPPLAMFVVEGEDAREPLDLLIEAAQPLLDRGHVLPELGLLLRPELVQHRPQGGHALARLTCREFLGRNVVRAPLLAEVGEKAAPVEERNERPEHYALALVTRALSRDL